jgi:hypothetical protein
MADSICSQQYPTVTNEKLSYQSATYLTNSSIVVPQGKNIYRAYVLPLGLDDVSFKVRNVVRNGSTGFAAISDNLFISTDELYINIVWP